MHTHFLLIFLAPFKKMNIFLHFKVCYIYEDKKCPYGKHSDSSQGPAVVKRQVHTLQFTKKKYIYMFERINWCS